MAKKRTERTERTQRTAAGEPAAPGRIVPELAELLRVGQPIVDQFCDEEMPGDIPSLVRICAYQVGRMASWVDPSNPDFARMSHSANAARRTGAWVIGILDTPHAADNINDYLQRLAEQARTNLAKWGPQDLETLALVAIEECGELAKAVLRWTKEGVGGFAAVEHEAIDLGAVCVQFLWLIDQDSRARLSPMEKVVLDIELSKHVGKGA
jgi:NTP pyrophosphatase (non-canonical NTP hydrolase)